MAAIRANAWPMPAFPITSLYAALLTVLFLVLSVRVIGLRRDSGVLLGTGGEAALERAVRSHANFAEYAPFGLLLMLLAEPSAPAWAVHLAGIALLLGRIAHARCLWTATADARWRIGGMALTFSSLTVSAAALLWTGLRAVIT